MKRWNLLKLSLFAMSLFAASAFTACVDDNEDNGMPYLKVSPEVLAFTAEGTPPQGGAAFTVQSNRPWTVEIAEADQWVTVEPMSGSGTTRVEVSVPASNENRVATLEFQLRNTYAVYETVSVRVQQGEVVEAEEVYRETFGTTGQNTPVASYDGWVTTGGGAADVAYASSAGVDIRSNLPSTGEYSGYEGSGGSNMMFGQGDTWFTVQRIALPEGVKSYDLTFGASYYKAPDTDIYGQLNVQFSKDGELWTSAVPYTFSDFKPTLNWNLAAIRFTLKEWTEHLYIKFLSTKPADGNYRIDDIVLATGNGGQEIDLDNGSAVDPEPQPTDALFYEHFGQGAKVVIDGKENWGYIDQYTDYGKQGDAYVEGTTTYAGVNASVRSSSASAPVPPFSGGGNVWMTSKGGELTVSKLVLESSQTRMTLSFGVLGGDDPYGSATYDPSTGNVKAELSADGQNWKPLTVAYEAQGADGKSWSTATAPFTLKKGVTNLYVRISGKVVRIDDVKLAESEGGQEVDLEGGSTEPEPEPGEALLYETFGEGASAKPYPTPDDYTGWVTSGSASADVAYSGTNTQLRSSSPSDKYSGYEGSGAGNLYFSAENNAFVIGNIAPIPGNVTSFILTFGANIYKPASVDPYYSTYSAMVSVDGTTWSDPLAFEVDFKADMSWNLATARFRLDKHYDRLYLKFSAVAGNNRIDDVKLAAGDGTGQEVSFGGSTDPEPGETVKMTIPELVARIIPNTAATVLDAANDVEFTAVVQNDVPGGNYTFNHLILATEGATAKHNGLVMYGNVVAPSELGLDKGDRVKVTLAKGKAKVQNYQGFYELLGDKTVIDWFRIEKLEGKAEIVPVTIRSSQLADFQGMTVKVSDVAPKAAGEKWEGVVAFTTPDGDMNAYVKTAAPVFSETSYSAVKGDICGIASVKNNVGQIVPRTIDDVKAFSDGATDPDPSKPTITGVDPAEVSFPAEGGEKSIAVTVAGQGDNALSVSGLSGLFSASVSGNTVKVTAQANTGGALAQTLTISVANGNSVTVPVSMEAKATEPGSEILFKEDFAALEKGGNTATSDNCPAWSGNANFPTVNDAVYEAKGAVKLGKSKGPGSMTSRELDLSAPFTVKMKVKGWTSVEGKIIVTVGAEEREVSYTATMADAFEEVVVSFPAATDAAAVTVSTSAKRAFIDEIVIEK